MTEPPAYRFCPRCGSQLDSRVVKIGEPPRLVCHACAFVFFLDPKVATGVVFSYDGGILLVQRAIHPSYGKWVFPGGYVDRGETLEAAALREVWEESGLAVRLTRLLGVYSYLGNPVIVVAYAGEVAGGSLKIDDESLAVRAFPPAEIPWDQLAFPSTVQVLKDYLGLPCTA
ncbi:MAG: NUDIX hydrolase [candidate division NC10 bacterium RBG_16_65_8]|nr:MAG: NUDIX hydrolase [candidate division NC10 bacterium RBG_16_65_8]